MTHVRTSGRFVGLLLAILSATFALAASSARADEWTLERALSHASDRAPRVRLAHAEAGVASAHQEFAHTPVLGNPVVSARVLAGPDSTAATYGLSVAIPFDFSGRRSAWGREAEQMVQAATATIGVARAEARLDAYHAYVDVSTADAVVANARARAETANTFLENTRRRFEAGAATSLDVALAEREVAVAEAAVESALRQAENARERFRTVLDLDALESIDVEELLRPSMPEGVTIPSLTTRALRHRRELASLRAQEARYRAMVQRVRRDAIEPVTVAAEGERQGNREAAYGAGGSLSVPVPIVRTAQAERAVANRQGDVARVEHDLTSHSVEREVAAAYRSFEHVTRELDIIEQRAIPAAEHNLELSERLLIRGATDVFRVLLARDDVFLQRQHRIELLRDAWRALAELERAAGGFE